MNRWIVFKLKNTTGWPWIAATTQETRSQAPQPLRFPKWKMAMHYATCQAQLDQQPLEDLCTIAYQHAPHATTTIAGFRQQIIQQMRNVNP
ncbi:hypothetical protein HMPREF2604_05150 [Corynebacterium sp. HMSC055A01]|nr:hypothetical protein HMPREF2604_05150 [Corynebacterium sp. HMSC055A01]